MGLMPSSKKSQRCLTVFLPHEDTVKRWLFINLEAGPHQTLLFASNLILDFLASSTVRNKFGCKPLHLWYCYSSSNGLRHYVKHQIYITHEMSYLILLTLKEVGLLITPTLQMRKLRRKLHNLGEMTELKVLRSGFK